MPLHNAKCQSQADKRWGRAKYETKLRRAKYETKLMVDGLWWTESRDKSGHVPFRTCTFYFQNLECISWSFMPTKRRKRKLLECISYETTMHLRSYHTNQTLHWKFGQSFVPTVLLISVYLTFGQAQFVEQCFHSAYYWIQIGSSGVCLGVKRKKRRRYLSCFILCDDI